ncbi:hypothetical protein [Ornithinibacillus sp. JPR2-1]|uniref:hypothetical protein n=1 Tax=Ornithinibacillus sp. JPR2-1 TaxID=2094019 RepID=UPI0031D50D4C
MKMTQGINVPIGPAIVEYGEGADQVIFDITKGGIVFSATTTKQDTTVDQHGDTVVKSIVKGSTAQATVPFALHDLKRLAAVMPGSKLIEDITTGKKKLKVYSGAGYDMLKNAKPLVIKPTDPDATPDDWITIPLAGAIADPNYTYNSDNERVTNVTFVAYPDLSQEGLLYVMGDDFVESTGS